MLGINYESSDEEDIIPASEPDLTNISQAVAPAPEPLSEPAPLEQPTAGPGSIKGPSQGPTATPPPAEGGLTNDAPPGSPFTTNRARIQNLTLPTVPNFDIPPSPPGSPPQKATKKFAAFLELKQKGQHFNQRLESSSVLRDPGHLQKLMDFAGVDQESQYASTLPEGLAVPIAYPKWAYAEELKASQKRIFTARQQEKSRAPREAIEFVSSAKPSTQGSTNTQAVKATKQAVTAKVASSQSTEQQSRFSSQIVGKRKELEHRSRDDSESRTRWRSSSTSPKRRRSQPRE